MYRYLMVLTFVGSLLAVGMAPAGTAARTIRVKLPCQGKVVQVRANSTKTAKRRLCLVSREPVYLGVWQAGVPTDFAALDAFKQDAGKQAAIVVFWRDWGSRKSTIKVDWLRAIAARGSVPLIAWSPANWDPGTNQAPYQLRAIISGGQDAYIREWARTLAAYGQPVLLRWAYQMNGDWYPWGGHPRQYVAAWRHIHDLFAEEGATNVKWVWVPNVFWPRSRATDPKRYFPGKRYVDWIGLAGYNVPSRGWMSFSQLFKYAYKAVTRLSSKPFMIGETGSGEPTRKQALAGRSKARWITTALSSTIPAMRRVRAVIWFNEAKTATNQCGCDTRIETSVGAQHAFAQAVSSSLYKFTWP